MTPLRQSYSRFCELLTIAETSLSAGDLPAAVGVAQVAARYAFPANVGLFGSQRLERILLNAGKQISSVPSSNPKARNNETKNILHVLTYARPVGGDSRCVWRWIREDTGNRHSVVVTSQADINCSYKVPDTFEEATIKSGGFLRTLSAPPSRPIDQARELRSLCREMDIVVLHLFPYDVVPILALAGDCPDAKTLFVNHSDHTFWIGGSVAHGIVDLRHQNRAFVTSRRGLDPERCSVLPIPLSCGAQSPSKREAKIALGCDPEVVLLLTVASPFKYSCPGQPKFLDLTVPVLARHPRATLVAVGPDLRGEWLNAKNQTDGRIVPLGTRWDTDILYSAADIYLDSVPFSSITSLLEAGSHGASLLGYRPSDPDLSLFGPGAPGLDGAIELADDAQDYQMRLTRLITDVDYRHNSADRLRSQITSVYIRAPTGPEPRNICTRKCTNVLSADVFKRIIPYLSKPVSIPHWLKLYPHAYSSKVLLNHLGRLAYYLRFMVSWQLYRKGVGLCIPNFLPPPLHLIIRRAGRQLRAQTVGRWAVARCRQGLASMSGKRDGCKLTMMPTEP